MLLNDKHMLLIAVAGLGLAGCGGRDRPDSISERGLPVSTSPVSADPPAAIGEAYTIGGQRFEPKDETAFDEVGYAIAHDGTIEPGNGLSFDPQSMTVAHRLLPLPSYAEVTNLETGKTAVVRIVARGPLLKDKIAALSPAVIDRIGLTGGGPYAIRFRRVNPQEAEKTVLRNGGAAANRLDTPPALLSALRRRLGETTGKPLKSTTAEPVTAKAPPPPAKPRPTPVGRPGAKFDAPDNAAPVTRNRGGDRFIVEEGGVRRVAPSAVRTVTEPVKIEDEASAEWFVQIASFGNRARAASLARKVGGSVVQAGTLWRVRKGPYPDQEEARRALGAAVTNGYRDARISH
jgi:rare lipoprotein A